MEKEELISYIRYLRKEKHLSIRQLGELSGVNRTTLSNVENSKLLGKPSAEILSKIAGPLGVTKEHLLQKAGYLEEKFDLDTVLFFSLKEASKTTNKIDLREIFNSQKFELYYAGIKLDDYQIHGIFKVIDTILMMQNFEKVKGEKTHD